MNSLEKDDNLDYKLKIKELETYLTMALELLLEKEQQGNLDINKLQELKVLSDLQKSAKTKTDELNQLRKEIIDLREENYTIKTSVIFRILKKLTSPFNSISPDSRLGELQKISVASSKTISQKGFKEYLREVKIKLGRREFQVLTNQIISENAEESLRLLVKENKNSRLVINPISKNELEQDRLINQPRKEDTQITACTVVSKNYIAFARVLTDSFLEHNPNGKMYVLLADELDDAINTDEEKFELVQIDQIGIDSLDSFCFKYNAIELNTATKAKFMQYLCTKHNLKKLIFFDPDILITNSLDNLWELLDHKSIVVTPHITQPIDDGKRPTELDIIKAGVYNLGFIGIAYNENTSLFLDWWHSKLYDYCIMDADNTHFLDQKWVDLVPMFDDVYALRHPGYNTAFWNLKHRKISIKQGDIHVNDKPLYFYHFSGFKLEQVDKISKHQNRFNFKNIPQMIPLFELYRDLLVEKGHIKTSKLKCKFDYFDNGIKIPLQAREIYRNDASLKSKFPNPFSTNTNNSFYNYLTEGIDNKTPKITRLAYQVYKDREDLHEDFIFEVGRNQFIDWADKALKNEYGFPLE